PEAGGTYGAGGGAGRWNCGWPLAFAPPNEVGGAGSGGRAWYCPAATPPAAKTPSKPANLTALTAARVRGAVVRGFLRDKDVMRVTLLDRRRGHLDEPGLHPEFLQRLAAAITHPGPQAADQLVHERGQVPLVRHTPLDPLGDELPIARLPRLRR